MLAGYLSLYPALWALGVNWGEARGLSPVWWGPVLWVTLEFGQTYIISGFPWELLGNGLYPHPMLLQVADLTGVYGLSFLVVLINSCLWRLLSPPRARRTRRYRYAGGRLPDSGPVAGLRLLPPGRGAKTGGQEPEAQGGRGPGQYQAGRKMEEGDGPGHPGALCRTDPQGQGGPTHRLARDRRAFLLPAHPGSLRPGPGHRQRERRRPALRLARLGTRRPTSERYFNRAYLLSPQGEVLGYYDKAHLVPYGEYVPLRRFMPFIGKMVPMVGDFAEGPVGATVSLPDNGAVGPLVCYESIFPNLSRAQVAKRRQAADQHHQRRLVRQDRGGLPAYGHGGAALRGEPRLPGPGRQHRHLCFIDARGQILWQSEIYVPEAHALELPLMPGGSLYTSIGDVFAWACLILAGLALIFARRRR